MGGFKEIVEGLIVFYALLTAAIVFALSAVALAVWRLAKTMKTTDKKHHERDIHD